jgi:hypothetical protein
VHETGDHIARSISALGLGDGETALAESEAAAARRGTVQRPLAWDCFESVCTCCVSFRVAGKVHVHVTSGRTLFEVIHNTIKWFESDHWL